MVAIVKEHRYRELFINVIPKHHHQHVGILSFRRNAPHHIPIDFVDLALLALEIDASTRWFLSKHISNTRSQAHTQTLYAITKFARSRAKRRTTEDCRRRRTHKNNSNNSEWEEEKKWAETKIPEFWNSKKPVFISAFGHSLFVRLRSRLKLFLHAVTRCRRYDTYIVRNTVGYSAGVSLLRSLFHTDNTHTPQIVFARPFKYCLYLLLFTYI